LLAIVLLAGCGKREETPLVPASGQVFHQSKPAAGALVILHPVANADPKAWPQGYPHATVADDGTFQIGTRAARDGAPAGDYKVLVQWPQSSSESNDPEATIPDRFRGKYANPDRSTWQVQVQPPKADLPKIDLN
jgi:hypothetical protein